MDSEKLSDEVLYLVDALSAPNDEIQDFIRNEIGSRRDEQQGSISVGEDLNKLSVR